MMLNQSLSSAEGSQKGSAQTASHTRHLTVQKERQSFNGKSHLILHTRVRSPANSCHLTKNKVTHSNIDLRSLSIVLKEPSHHSGTTPGSVVKIHSATRPVSIHRISRRHRSLSPQTIHNHWNDQNDTKTFPGQNKYLPKTEQSSHNSARRALNGENITLNSNERYISKGTRQVIDNDSISDLWGNTKDFHKNKSKTNKNRKKKYFTRCPCLCLLGCLLGTFILGTAIATALIGTLIKSQTTTTTTGVTSVTTIVTNTTMSTTQSTTDSTTTTSLIPTSTTQTTTTSTACMAPTNTIDNYVTASSGYTFQQYNYTANSTYIGILEFGFQGRTGSDYWYLDDVSIVDLNTSSSEMLINGDFENGTLDGWQTLCTSNCITSSGILVNSTCHMGSYCYEDGCKNGYDFLRQMFTMTTGHIYTLSFWLNFDSHNNAQAFVRIN